MIEKENILGGGIFNGIKGYDFVFVDKVRKIIKNNFDEDI